IAATAAKLPSSTAWPRPDSIRRDSIRPEAAARVAGVCVSGGCMRHPRAAGLAPVLDHAAVDQTHAASAVVGDLLLVGHQDDGVAFGVQGIEQGHDLGGGAAVEIAGRFVS